ncbi:hypothetical protein [Spirulina major]|uniref:hypothetical protein n=1 Tax=Spirulina major TaxID=270636 RepID=UPI001114C470|nr:hypothetical protein [Spirulina major]
MKIRVLLLAVSLGLGSASAALAAEEIRFLAIGDLPYSDAEQDAMTTSLRRAVQAADVPFVVHYGDFKSGGESCTDALLTTSRNDILSLLPGRVFYTPGDNEWTDCDRASLTHPLPELERLAKIRQLFFPQPLTIPAEWDYQTQPLFPENTRWRVGSVLFVTLHIVGTNNGRRDILLDDPEAAIALVEARDHANRVWLDAALAAADEQPTDAIVVVTQADITDADTPTPCTAALTQDCDAYAEIRAQLTTTAATFDQPMLLIHGDTNPYCLDAEFGGDRAPKLWRLNAWGDYQTPPDATEIVVRPDHAEQPFQIQTLIGKRAPDPQCSSD